MLLAAEALAYLVERQRHQLVDKIHGYLARLDYLFVLLLADDVSLLHIEVTARAVDYLVGGYLVAFLDAVIV